MTRGAETVTYRPEVGSDDMGNPTPAGDPIVFKGCAVWPRGRSAEDSGRQMTVIEGTTVIIPRQPGIEQVTSSGEVEWTSKRPGRWAKVEGNPFPWTNLSGAVEGLQVNLEEARG